MPTMRRRTRVRFSCVASASTRTRVLKEGYVLTLRQLYYRCIRIDPHEGTESH